MVFEEVSDVDKKMKPQERSYKNTRNSDTKDKNKLIQKRQSISNLELLS